MNVRLGLAVFCLALMALLTLGTGCGNGGCTSDADCGADKCVDGSCVQCRSDKDCSAKNKCSECRNYSCAAVADCCTTDAECGSARRCFNVPGKSWGRCAPK